jgi:RecA-family ATPase
MLSGDPGAGKTFVALAIAAAITVGQTPYANEPRKPADVLYLSAENSPHHVLRPRFDLLGGDPERFHILEGSITGQGDHAVRGSVRLSDVQLLEDALQQTQAQLVIVDPIQSYLGADVDAHRSNETRPVLDGLGRLAEEHGACALMVRHLSKAPTGKAIHRGLGSIDLTGAVRTELLAGSLPDDPSQRALVQVKSNLGQLGKSIGYFIGNDGTFRWTGESQITAGEVLAAESDPEERSEIEEACEFLRDALATGPRKVKELEASSGVSERTLRRASKRLDVRRSREGAKGPWLWALR